MIIQRGVTFLFFLVFNFVSAQAQNNISAFVTTADHKPVSSVSVILLQDSSFLFGTITDEKGEFKVAYNFASGKKYSLTFSLVGYQPVTKSFIYPDTNLLSPIVLNENRATLATVAVTARKPLIINKVDRYIIDVENSFLANGNSGLEVLKKSPGIWVGSDGSIRIKGNQSVTVMINDVVQRMSEEELGEYLKTLPSEDISKIEVIHNPPSEFEASGSGGIVHIILKKSRKNGMSGSVNTQYKIQGTKPYLRGGASLDYKLKNLYLFGSSSVTIDKSRYIGTTDIVYKNKSLAINNYVNRINNNDRQQYRFGLVYDIAANQSIAIQTNGTASQLVQYFYTDINYKTDSRLITGNSISAWIRKPRQTSTTFNYAWNIDSAGSSLKIIGDYTRSSKTETNDFSAVYNDSLPDSRYRNSSPNTTSIYSIQADFTKVLKNKTELKAGSKYASVNRNNVLTNEDYLNNNWVINRMNSNHFIYDEDLLMYYSSVERTIGKTSIKGGLRGEETFSKGTSLSSREQFTKKYFGLFPSLFILKKLSDKKENSIYLNYSRRLQRPAFNELNPYRLQFDNFTSMVGNPDLLPQYTHNIEAGYNFSNGYTTSIYFSTTKNVIAQLANPVGDNKIEYQFNNFNNSKEYGFMLNVPLKILKNWTSNNSFSLYHLSYNINNSSNRQTSFYAKSINTITLKNIVDIDTYIEYRSPYVDANSRAAYQLYTDLGLAKKILKTRVRLRFSLVDPFNLLRESTVTDYTDFRIDFYQKRPTRTAAISCTYNFSSGKKFKSKKVEENNTEEKSRIGN